MATWLSPLFFFLSFLLLLPCIRWVPGYCAFRKFEDSFNISRNRLDLKNLHLDPNILLLGVLGVIICVGVLGICMSLQFKCHQNKPIFWLVPVCNCDECRICCLGRSLPAVVYKVICSLPFPSSHTSSSLKVTIYHSVALVSKCCWVNAPSLPSWGCVSNSN